MEEQALSLLQVVTKLFLPDHFDVKLEGLKTRLVEVVSRAKVRDMEKFDLAVDLMRSAYAVLEVTSSPPREYYLVCECMHVLWEEEVACPIGPEVEEGDAARTFISSHSDEIL